MKSSSVILLIAVFSAFSLTGCSGDQGSVDTPALNPTEESPAVPAVAVEAPETAIAGIPFTVSWSASDATTCSADFTDATDVAGSAQVTASAAGNIEYSVTCTGAGGSGTASASVNVGAATAEGFWQGTTGGGRILAGVVTKEGDYWLAYSTSENSPAVGFYSGYANQTMTTAPAGTLVSTDLREVNFETGFGGGDTAAGLLSAGAFQAKTSIAGSLDAIGSTGTFDVSVTGGTGISVQTGTGTAILTDAGVLTMTFAEMTQTASGVGAASIANVTDIFSGAYVGGTFTAASGVETINGLCAQTAGPLNLCSFMVLPSTTPFDTVSGSVTLAGGGTLNTSVLNMGQTNVLTYTLTSTSSSLPSITADTLALDSYNSAYESTPEIALLAGSYVGMAGIGANQSGADTATFEIDPTNGAISGAEPSGCTYTGTVEVHPTGGNLYDIQLVFTGCLSANDGEYEGVAVLTDNQLTVMAMDAASRSHGFLFVGARP